jgi:surface protein
MKTLNKYIFEKLKITKDNIKSYSEPIYFPKNRNQIMDIVDEKIKDNSKCIDVSDISLSDLAKSTIGIIFCQLNVEEIIGLESWDVKGIKKMHQMFQNSENIKKIDLSTWDVSECERFDGMFDGCKNLTDIGDISNWKINPNADMSNMFNGCSKELIKKLPKHILDRL